MGAGLRESSVPVTTPVHQETIDVPITVQAPSEPGHWWIILVIDAEPSADKWLQPGIVASRESTRATVQARCRAHSH